MVTEGRSALGAPRLWLAALAASLLAFALMMPLGWLATGLALLVPREWPNVPFLAGNLLEASLVEGCKLAALWWILRRNPGSWPVLGLAYGVLAAAWSLLRWGLDWWQYPGFVTPTPWLLVHVAGPILFHALLGLLAAGLARAPGRVWWGWAGASLAAFVLGSWSSVLMVTVPIRGEVGSLIEFARPLSLVLFGLAVWRVQRHGARHLVVLGVGVIAGLVLLLGVLQQIVPVSGVQRSDPVTVLVVAAGLCFLAAMVARQSVLPWMRGAPHA